MPPLRVCALIIAATWTCSAAAPRFPESSSGHVFDGSVETRCELENVGYRFAEFPCSQWSDCEHSCPSYGYGVVACSELVQNCPVCCARTEAESPVAVAIFVVFGICITIVLVGMIAHAVARGDSGSVFFLIGLLLFCFPRSRGVRGRGR